MHRNLRWKLVVILALVIGTSAFAWVPPVADRLGLPLPGFTSERRLLLGLDLRGGVQFVLRVNAQEALVHHCHIVTIRGNSYRMRQHTDLWHALHTAQDPEPAPSRRRRARQEVATN